MVANGAWNLPLAGMFANIVAVYQRIYFYQKSPLSHSQAELGNGQNLLATFLWQPNTTSGTTGGWEDYDSR
jgi:hypothetical protein